MHDLLSESLSKPIIDWIGIAKGLIIPMTLQDKNMTTGVNPMYLPWV